MTPKFRNWTRITYKDKHFRMEWTRNWVNIQLLDPDFVGAGAGKELSWRDTNHLAPYVHFAFSERNILINFGLVRHFFGILLQNENLICQSVNNDTYDGYLNVLPQFCLQFLA